MYYIYIHIILTEIYLNRSDHLQYLKVNKIFKLYHIFV